MISPRVQSRPGEKVLPSPVPVVIFFSSAQLTAFLQHYAYLELCRGVGLRRENEEQEAQA